MSFLIWEEKACTGNQFHRQCSNSGEISLFIKSLLNLYVFRMEAVAKFDFKATADDELSFGKGNIVKVSIGILWIHPTCYDGKCVTL